MPGTPSDHETASTGVGGRTGAITPVVIFVPGLGLDGRSWRAVRSRLGGPHAVVVLPSLGQRAPRGTDLRVEAQAERLLAVLDGRSAILVGHSAGCPVVVQAATLSPSVVGLVLVGPVTDPTANTWKRMLLQWARTAPHERPGEVPILGPQYWRTGLGPMLRGMDTVRHFRTDLALGRLVLPVEIVRGSNDKIATKAWSSQLQRASRGRLTSIHAASHMVPLTHPEAVVAAVARVRASLGHEAISAEP